ncbi:MAG: hypothetical protein ABIZ52_02325 [Candidatus Limnocylindrales bacterium]
MTPTPTRAAAPTVRRELEPTHPCIRCGRPGVPADAGLCELCNPLELSQPSATQMHGIAAVGIIAFIFVLAVAGRAALSGTGPFVGTIGAVGALPEGLVVTLSVRNDGKKATATTCAIAETPPRIGAATQVVQTPLIQPGATVEFTAVVTKLGLTPIPLAADCSSP